jgi:hypothetical protein
MQAHKRHKWTDDDIAELKDCYKKIPLFLSENIIARHGRAGCYTKAERMGLNGQLKKNFPDLSAWSVARRAYLAGIVDGEGTITIVTMGKWSKKQRKKYFYQRAVACISNTDYKLLDYLKSLDLGGLSYDKRQGKSHWKQSFQWSLSSPATVYTFLKAIEPYLVIKKDKANEVIAWILEKRLQRIFNATSGK